MGRGDVKVK